MRREPKWRLNDYLIFFKLGNEDWVVKDTDA